MAKGNGKIKVDPKNYRKHSERNKELIRKSLEELQCGRSILLDADNVVVAGNGVFTEAEKLKIPIRVIETNGKELIAVKRTDLKPDDAKRKELALADNAVSDTSEWDDLGSWDTETLEKWDIETGEDESFTLPSGDKAPFQQMTFTLADAQAERIKQCLKDVEINEGTTYGNENSNGNALHQIVLEWAEQKKLASV